MKEKEKVVEMKISKRGGKITIWIRACKEIENFFAQYGVHEKEKIDGRPLYQCPPQARELREHGRSGKLLATLAPTDLAGQDRPWGFFETEYWDQVPDLSILRIVGISQESGVTIEIRRQCYSAPELRRYAEVLTKVIHIFWTHFLADAEITAIVEKEVI